MFLFLILIIIPERYKSASKKEFLTSIIHILNKYRKDILYNLLKNQEPNITQEEIKEEIKLKNKLIRFTHALPKFVGDDLNTYGPYDEEDVANLPEKVATVLIRRKKAQEISNREYFYILSIL